MLNLANVLKMLEKSADKNNLAGMQKYGMELESRLGVKVPKIRKIARDIGKDHQLALELWRTGIVEARILASLVDEPSAVTEKQMDEWVVDFNSWDVCDQVCMNLFDKTPFVWKKIKQWAKQDPEYVKRAGYALIAGLAVHNKQADDENFLKQLPLIEYGAMDKRNFVKKAVSWSLRSIGKRNIHLNKQVLTFAEKLKKSDNKTSQWIGRDTIQDITSDATKRRFARQAGIGSIAGN